MYSRGSLLHAVSIQKRVLYALLMREVITRFGRKNLGVLWVFVEPMIFTLGVAGLWTAAGFHHGSSIPIVAFAITGYSSVLLWRNCASQSVGAISANLGLLYHRNVRVIDVLLVRSILEIAGASASFGVLTVVFIATGWMEPPVNALMVVFGWFMLAWFGTALALLVGAGTAYSHVVEKLWTPAAYLLFPLSGAAYMVEWLPTTMQDVLLTLPMVHGVEMLRDGYFGNAVKTHYSFGYMFISCLLLSLMSLYFVREAGRRVETQ